MIRALSIALLVVAASASAKDLPCSVHPAKGTPESALQALAKVSEAGCKTGRTREFRNRCVSDRIRK